MASIEKLMEPVEEFFPKGSSAYSKIKEYIELMNPDSVKVLLGTKEEYEKLINEMLQSRKMVKLNEKEYPNSYLYRSDPNDVARTEQDTYVCTRSKEEAGPTNNWMPPEEAKQKLRALLSNAMDGKRLLILPYLLGPEGSQFSQAGIELTDSPYVAASQMIIAKVGKAALEKLDSKFVFGIHATLNLDPKNRYIVHFPEERLIVAVNTAYGGNALLSKKCHALRIASYTARQEGVIAEHMMAIELIDPEGRHYGITGAFPSASGKTNLAMLMLPNDYASKGWRAKLLSDDISWLNLTGGRLNAINPEYGFFGVAPGTNEHTNPNAMKTIKGNTIFTNVALDPEHMLPWWEGLEPMPSKLIDWQGKEFSGEGKAAHPNSRFTTPITQYPELSEKYYDKIGLPIHAILFGGRRRTLVPLVFEAFSWEHGILIGAMLRAERTAAAVGKLGEIINDPMAMRPFCGYNMADYFEHWCNIGKRLVEKPRIYNVNWFRTDEKGEFLWPGFGENMRVLKWVIDRVNGVGKAVKTPIGYIPEIDSFDRGKVSKEAVEKLFHIDKEGWLAELDAVEPFFKSFGERFPEWLWKEFYELRSRIENM